MSSLCLHRKDAGAQRSVFKEITASQRFRGET
jgi:hypothetical protein